MLWSLVLKANAHTHTHKYYKLTEAKGHWGGWVAEHLIARLTVKCHLATDVQLPLTSAHPRNAGCYCALPSCCLRNKTFIFCHLYNHCFNSGHLHPLSRWCKQRPNCPSYFQSSFHAEKGIQLLKHNSIKRIPRVQTGLYLFTFFEMKVSIQQPAYKMLPDRELASQPPYLLLAFSFPKLH